jgi:hypothetical protein
MWSESLPERGVAMPDAPDVQASDAAREPSLVAWRLALAALEAEKARLVAKYSQRIAESQKAIKTLQRGTAPKSPLPHPKSASQPKPARKKKLSG